MNTVSEQTTAPAWASRWLVAAGLYNLLWGALTIGFPQLLFDLARIERINYPEIWQCVGMIVGVYGIGYLIAASNPRAHWPIVLVGLLGKVFGPIGFVAALLRGTFPPLFGLTILTNDLIWWIPFAMILWDAAKRRSSDQRPDPAMCSHYVKESRINASPELVFRFHESAEALRQLIPPWENMGVAESAGSILPGSRVVLRGRLGLLPIRWVAVHTEYNPPHLFADRQESGPFAWWYHRHRFLDDGEGGTILRDEVEYQAPLGLIGSWLGGWLIRQKLERMFAYRHATTCRLIESGEWSESAGRPSMR
jgi:ligand-binding SRPBCC domain-containing protein